MLPSVRLITVCGSGSLPTLAPSSEGEAVVVQFELGRAGAAAGPVGSTDAGGGARPAQDCCEWRVVLALVE